ncbi:MAG: ferritin-like domain-containing protein [Hyphomonadaceae bacterium]
MALDPIAERIRSPGPYSPVGNSIATKSTIKSDTGVPSDDEMLADIEASTETVVTAAHAALERAGEAGDQATADLMRQRVSLGERAAWLLRAHLAK